MYNSYYHIVLSLISVLFLIPYYFSYKVVIEDKYINSLLYGKFLYTSGLFSSVIWFVLPFLPQPRLYDVFENWNDLWGYLSFLDYVAITYSAIFFIIFFCTSMQAIKVNLKVTQDNFCAPKKLLTDGIYGELRHPMLAKDFLCHFFFAMLMGGIYTLALMPIYLLINLCFIGIQEKLVLREKFKTEYEHYSKSTPIFFNSTLTIIFTVGVLIILFNLFMK